MDPKVSLAAEQSHLHQYSVRERQEMGKALRKQVPRSSHANWQPHEHRSDPVALLKQSNQDRLPHLVPFRYGRMRRSPFAFFRGAAIIMAADLAHTPTTNLQVQASGDSHLLNFGGYATPERNLVFDLNDFDETHPAPWEWDLKRLAASVVVAGRSIHLAKSTCHTAAIAATCSYRTRMAEYAQMPVLDRWYARVDATELLEHAHSDRHRKSLKTDIDQAHQRVSLQQGPQWTTGVDGDRRIIDEPPLLYHPADRLRHNSTDDFFEEDILSAYRQYYQSLRDDRRTLLDRYQLSDVAVKVTGTGSVGKRCAIALFVADADDVLFLQIKEATNSVLEAHLPKSKYANQGQRVVAGQRLMQADSDIFLGWAKSDRGHHFHFRQFRGIKLSVELDKMTDSDLVSYASLCGWTLARAHARSGDPAMIAGYLGNSDKFDEAIARFAHLYADQTEQDYSALNAAIQSGRIEAIED